MIVFPDWFYDLIYADPPWRYGGFANHNENRNKRLRDGSKFRITPYDGMSTLELMKLPVVDIAKPNSVLLLWTTMPIIPEALEVMKAWGFEYKTVAFTWIKQNEGGIGIKLGLGNYTRANAELCLLGTRGHGLKRIAKNIPQVHICPIQKHSQKPDEFRKRIVRLFGQPRRIELFARTIISGWDTWGDDTKLEAQPLESNSFIAPSGTL